MQTDDRKAEADLRSKLQFDLPYDPIRTVPPILAIISRYAIPTAYRLVDISNEIAGNYYFVAPAYLTPPRYAGKDITVTFPHSTRQAFIDHPKIDLEGIPDDRPDAADPVLPVYYCYDGNARKILATDRLTRKAVEWSSFTFERRLSAVEAVACPISGVVYVLYWIGGQLLINRITTNNNRLAAFPRRPYFGRFFGRMVGSSDAALYVIQDDGPLRITIDGHQANLTRLVTPPTTGRYHSDVFLILPNGLLLTKFWTNDAFALPDPSLVVIDPSAFDRLQTILPFDGRPSVFIDSAACSRTDRDLVYLTSSARLFEFHLSSDLFMDLRNRQDDVQTEIGFCRRLTD
jgi:hypothetical protein